MDAMELADSLGRNIKKRRVLRDLSRAKLSEKSGVSDITIRRIESGQCVGLGLDNLLSVANELDVTISQLFQEAETDCVQITEKSSSWDNMLKRLEDLTEGQQILASRILETVLSNPM